MGIYRLVVRKYGVLSYFVYVYSYGGIERLATGRGDQYH